MQIEAGFDRCAICLERQPLTLEHVLPAVLGGTLTSPIQCKRCNSELGHSLVAPLKGDAAIRLAARGVRDTCPGLYEKIESGQRYVATDTSGQSVRLVLKNGRFVAPSGEGPNGSLIFDGLVRDTHVRGILDSEGLAETELTVAMERLSAARPNDLVQLSDSITAVNREIVDDTIFPALSGASTMANDRAFVLIAYNWLCVLLGSAVLAPEFDTVRGFITGGGESEAVAVTHAISTSRQYAAFHALDANVNENLTVTIRLFRMLAYIVSFSEIASGALPGVVGIQELAPPRFLLVERPS